MEELNSALHKFNQIVIGPTRQICRNTIAFCMTQVMLPLLEKIGEIDSRFKCTCPMPNESYFPGMKTSCINEFELTVILTNLLEIKSFEDMGVQDASLTCYGHVVTEQAPHSLDDVLLTTGHSQGLLSAEKIRQVFAQLVSQASSVLPVMGITLEVIYKDPIIVLKIFRGPEVYLFELIPAFMFHHDWPSTCVSWCEEPNDWITENDIKVCKDMGFYALAQPSPGHPNDPSLFRISFNMAEKYLLRYVVTDNNMLPSPVLYAFRKDCDRILRMIRESDKDDFSPVCSYHIRTALLHECKRVPDPRAWAHDKLGERFLELLRGLIVALDNQNLPHFFVKDCNLLQFYIPEKLVAAAGRLKAIYQDIYMSPLNSIRLQC